MLEITYFVHFYSFNSTSVVNKLVSPVKYLQKSTQNTPKYFCIFLFQSQNPLSAGPSFASEYIYIYIYIYWWIEGHWLAIMVDQPWRTYKSINDQEWPQCKSRTTLQFVLNNIYFIVMAIFRIGLYSLTSQNIVISIL